MQALKNEKKVVSSLCNKRWVWIRESGSESTNMSVWLENEESTKGSSNGCKRLLSWDRRLTNYASVLKFMNLMESTHAPQRSEDFVGAFKVYIWEYYIDKNITYYNPHHTLAYFDCMMLKLKQEVRLKAMHMCIVQAVAKVYSLKLKEKESNNKENK